MAAAFLPDRGVVKVAGEDARAFLNGLFTIDMGKVGTDRAARYGALLTPQGKLLVDFIAAEADGVLGGAFVLDCPRSLAADLARRLALYRLRARVVIEDLSDSAGVTAFWSGDQAREEDGIAFADPRLPELGDRLIAPRELAESLGSSDAGAYDAHRIGLGVPQGGRDFVYGDAFPHEVDLDQLGGVDFDKGCYVGQEVVSRMEHRGTARARIVPVRYAQGVTPPEGAEVSAGARVIGRAGSGAPGGRGLALLRLDRLAEALAAGEPLTAGGLALTALRPAFARFAVPGAPA